VRIDQLRKNYDVAIRWTAFPLHPEIPEEGLTLEELFAGRVDVKQAMGRLKKVADELGVPLGERTRTYNSRLAHELAKWAESKDKGDAFHQAVYRSYFVDGQNIGKAEALIDLAESIGLPKDEAERILDSRTFKEAVDSDWSRSREMGVSAVPTFVMDHQAIVGAQPYETLDEFLKKNRVPKLDKTVQEGKRGRKKG
jgi:predicted DsbA family dithiol-disulfide isomerase